MIDYNAIVEEKDLYSDFVMSGEWSNHLAKISAVSTAVADAINKYGIGGEICNDEPYVGQYEFESGQLLDCIPSSVKRELEEDIESCYDLICGLAKSYAEYVVENA